MQTIRKSLLNAALALGLCFIVAGSLLLVFFMSGKRMFFFRPIFFLVFGALLLYISFVKTHKAKHIFLGSLFALTGILFLFADSKMIPYGLNELWPCIVINTAISLIPAGVFRYKKIHPVFFVPAVVIALMGIIFLLFSLDIITQSFSKVLSMWWPLLFVLSGIVLVILYFTNQKKNFEQEEETI